jgi:hypothetical protein
LGHGYLHGRRACGHPSVKGSPSGPRFGFAWPGATIRSPGRASTGARRAGRPGSPGLRGIG